MTSPTLWAVALEPHGLPGIPRRCRLPATLRGQYQPRRSPQGRVRLHPQRATKTHPTRQRDPECDLAIVLSGGERSRAHMAKGLKSGGNLLPLDEPTNDLDVDTLRSLEAGLLAFAGSAIVIRHDRWFLDRIVKFRRLAS